MIYILCPHCGEDLGDIHKFILEVQKKQNETLLQKNNIDPTKLILKPNLVKDINFILNALHLDNLCCRSHVLGYLELN
jgi:DNA-directed RNA polymerase subunit N (RpoN/RPB10)